MTKITTAPVPMRGRPFAVTAFMVTLSLLSTACSKHPSSKHSEAVEVGVVILVPQPVTISDELTGRTVATMASDIRPQVDGIIRRRLFEEGSFVRAGQPLYQIDPRLFSAARDQVSAQLENAQAALFSARAKADRYRTLPDLQAVSRQDVDDTYAAAKQAQASVHLYRAALSSARLSVEYTRVLAPISGRIGRSSVTPGALVSAGQAAPLASIQQLDPINVDLTQSSARLMQLRRTLARGTVLPTSTTVRLKLDDGTDYPMRGTVRFTEVTVDQDAGTVTLRARFPNPDGLLLPGMFVRVETPQGTVPDGILVPQQGITRDAKGGATALLIGPDNKVVERKVVADRAIGDKWLVSAGLQAGDRVIVQGNDKAEIGVAVKPVVVRLVR